MYQYNLVEHRAVPTTLNVDRIRHELLQNIPTHIKPTTQFN